MSLLKAVADALGVSSRQRVTMEVVPLEAAVLNHCELVFNKQFLSRAGVCLRFCMYVIMILTFMCVRASTRVLCVCVHSDSPPPQTLPYSETPSQAAACN